MTNIYRLAERNIKFLSLFPDVYGLCQNYRVRGIPDFVVSTVPSDIDFERKNSAREDAPIWYMPLKGCMLKTFYPRIRMRQMADNDILYDVSRSADVRSIIERLGFKMVMYVQNDYNHGHYNKEPVCNFEMHHALFVSASGDALFEY